MSAAVHDERTGARPVYFAGSRAPLFGWWHVPAADDRRGTAVVIVPPLAHEYMYAHRSVRRLAERLAQAGFGVLRYDHFGTGDSPADDAAPALVATWEADVRAAIAAAREAAGADRVVVVGLRAGAALSLGALAAGEPADGFVSWCGVPSGRAFTRELRALGAASAALHGEHSQAGAEPGSVSFAGFTLSAATVEALGTLRPASIEARPAARVLLVERDDFKADDALAAQLATLGAEVDRRRLAGYGAMMTDTLLATVPGAMLDAIVEWTERTLPERDPRAGAGASDPFVDALVIADEGAAMRETPLFVDGGRTAFGILAEPESTADDAAEGRRCVLLLNTGADHHVGPNRLYVTLARRWASAGYASLRVDVRGLGDAGLPDDESIVDAYPADASDLVLALVEHLRGQRGFSRVVVGGLCSGAYHAVEAARLGLPVDGVLAVNPQLYYNREATPVLADGETPEARLRRAVAPAGAAPESQARRRLRFAKRALTSALSRRLAPVLHVLDRVSRLARGSSAGAALLFNGACESLVVFSLGDLGLYYVETRAAGELARLRANPRFQLAIVPNADHTFTYRRAQEALVEVLSDALRDRFA